MHIRLASARLLALLKTIIIGISTAQDECVSYSQPNPIASQYPEKVTGTVNATLAILPIPLSLARSIIPKEYAILTDQYRSFLPDLPVDTYPALLQTVRDHDIRYGTYGIPDFSRASIDFPFVDLLGDGQTSFRWSPSMFISSSAPMAIQGAEEYGTTVYPSKFEPSCNAYDHHASGGTYLNVKGSFNGQGGFINTLFAASEEAELDPIRFPMHFFVNTTNQPSFADGKICDGYTRFFDTEISTGEYAAVTVRGNVKAKINLFTEEMSWPEAIGVRVDSAFIEDHLVSCESFRGYTPTPEQKVEFAWRSTPTFDWSMNSTMESLYSLQATLSNWMTPMLKKSP